ncbi:NAD-dependent epimerase/dehydratase family protein [Dyella psychrodurans]|uniref:NAD-dependent epimerase/dehydratase family protein n=1 Tax=Dyella psychrodurans TaxID=1927960 RepID=A0A370XAJ1_9GAMM|nr:NAD-dependent epimerase/dehydratase family protein [Dyella psychrodurans]RDS85291.1 NAD-dependent epimerase/dehydratase family protein [Dyella psychrodurans]
MRDAILVMGAGGFVGRHLLPALVQRGERVVAVTRRAFGVMDGVEVRASQLLEPEDRAPLLGMRVVNACSGESVTLQGLFDAIEQAAGQYLGRVCDGSRTVDAPRVSMDASLARELYGWMPSTPLLEGLRRTWEWLLTTRH